MPAPAVGLAGIFGHDADLVLFPKMQEFVGRNIEVGVSVRAEAGLPAVEKDFRVPINPFKLEREFFFRILRGEEEPLDILVIVPLEVARIGAAHALRIPRFKHHGVVRQRRRTPCALAEPAPFPPLVEIQLPHDPFPSLPYFTASSRKNQGVARKRFPFSFEGRIRRPRA